MLIDWYTVGAQALNFVILVWLMKRFLYKPVRRAIDAREKLIATELADAAATKAEAHKARDEFQHKNAELDRQRAALLNKATDDANAERQRLLDQAHQAANALSAKRQEALRNDARSLHQAIQRRTQDEVFAIARKALMDLATTDLEERLAAVFTRRLAELDSAAKAGLAKGLKAAADAALVRSAFELPADQRAVIQNALNETFSTDVHVRFETAPDLVSGIELATNGQKVGWSIAEYLGSLKNGVDELLKEKERVEVQAESKPAARADAAPKPDARTAPMSETKPEPTPAASVAASPDAKVAPARAARAAAPPDARVAPSTEAKAPTAEVIAVPRPEQPKQEARRQ